MFIVKHKKTPNKPEERRRRWFKEVDAVFSVVQEVKENYYSDSLSLTSDILENAQNILKSK